MIYRKNFVGTQNRVWIIHGERAIGVRAIEIRLYYLNQLVWSPLYIPFSFVDFRYSSRVLSVMLIGVILIYKVSIFKTEMSLNVRKRTFRHVLSAKIQISLRIRAVWSESSLGAFWIAKIAKFLHADNEDWSDCADAQADLSLRLAHMSEGVCFAMRLGSNVQN